MLIRNNNISWPRNISASGSGVGVQSGFKLLANASFHISACCGSLATGTDSGIACRYMDNMNTYASSGNQKAICLFVIGCPGLAG